ncbi:MAG: D-galactarate dehydratase [Paracoccaceae bacterium]
MLITRAFCAPLIALTLSGCALFAPASVDVPPETVAPAVAAPPPNPGGSVLGENGQSAEALDTSTAEDIAEATAAPEPAGERELGRVVVALGSPAEQGFWIKTQLAAAPGKGRVVTEDGQSVNVDLLPGTGGALLSFAAFRQLGLSLTDLPEVTVFAN